MYRYPAEESEWTEGIPGEVANGLSLIPVLRSSKRSSSSSLMASPAPILTSRPPTWTRGSGQDDCGMGDCSHVTRVRMDQRDARRVILAMDPSANSAHRKGYHSTKRR